MGYLRYFYETSNLAEKIDLNFTSAGIEAREGMPANEEIVNKGKELGFDISSHRSRHATFEMMKKASVILVTDNKQLKRIRDYFPQFADHTYHIQRFGVDVTEALEEIEDPGRDPRNYRYDHFFELAIPEGKRVWNYLETVFTEALEKRKEISRDIFRQPSMKLESRNPPYSWINQYFVPLCPNCQSRRLRRIRRRGFLQRKVLPIFRGYPYHCGNCGKEFVLFVGKDASRSDKYLLQKEVWRNFFRETRKSR